MTEIAHIQSPNDVGQNRIPSNGDHWTPFHAKYFAHELTQRFASRITAEGFNDSDNLSKITASLSEAQVDLSIPN